MNQEMQLLTQSPDESHGYLWRVVPEPFLNYSPRQIIQHHQTSSSTQSLNQDLLVIADHPDLPANGLLIVNLNFHNVVDALRQKLYFASDFVPSVSVGETSWSETLANACLPLYPRRRFAVFADEGFHPRYLMREALEKMNGGIMGRRAGTGTIFGEWETGERKGDGGREALVEWWRKNVREWEWEGRCFVLVTKEAWDEGKIVLVTGKTEGDGFVETLVHTDRVGEILVWLYVGLIGPNEVNEMDKGDNSSLKELLAERKSK